MTFVGLSVFHIIRNKSFCKGEEEATFLSKILL